MRYNYLNITERELLLIYLTQGLSLCRIAKLLGRNKSTISRELARNKGDYLPSKATARYRRRRKKCRPHKLLENPELFALVKKLFLDCQWLPEQIVARLKLENYPIRISYKTIYRAFTQECLIRRIKNVPRAIVGHGVNFDIVASHVALKATSPIGHELSARPVETNERVRRGDWEADSIVGFNRKSGLLTLVDRKSRFLICRKLARLGSKEVKTAMIGALQGQPLHSIMPDRSREFQLHGNVTTELGIEFYFPPPHQPWQRGTEPLNHHPRKCLGYRTLAEVYFSTTLHLA